MAYYISLDAGGTKCTAVLYDDNMNLLGRGYSGGVNTTQTTKEDAVKNVKDCLKSLFSTVKPDSIAEVSVSFVGEVDILKQELQLLYPNDDITIQNLSEAKAGMIAGALRERGVLTISGTGSDAFWVHDGSFKQKSTVGGFGPILGDQGSGTWIGLQALQEAIKTAEGWGNSQILLDLIRSEWNVKSSDHEMVQAVHKSEAPFRTVASLTRLVSKAIEMGDSYSLSLVENAGNMLALQTLSVLNRLPIPEEDRHVVCCGGGWKTHPNIYKSFCSVLREKYPDLPIQKPLFEHVMAGPVYRLMKSGHDKEEIQKICTSKFSDYVIKW